MTKRNVIASIAILALAWVLFFFINHAPIHGHAKPWIYQDTITLLMFAVLALGVCFAAFAKRKPR